MMATKIYDVETILLIDGTEVRLVPLKIKYLREFMEKFEAVKKAGSDDEAIEFLLDCALIAMKQYYPEIKTTEQLEDTINLPAIYKVIDVAAGIKVNENNEEESIKDQATESGSTWESLDLAKLEAEVFLLGIWKDYEELESSLSMPELVATLGSKRELDYDEKKFLAAIQGVDLDKESGKSKGQQEWEDMKARVFSRGQASNSNDVLSLQGPKAKQLGFGIGMGLDYENLT